MLKLPTDKRLSPHKRGYGARWRKIRNEFIARNPLCRFCLHLGNIKSAKVVDHIKPHRGDVGLLYDLNNLQSLCASCHDKHKQRQEKSGYLVGATADGMPVDLNHHWLSPQEGRFFEATEVLSKSGHLPSQALPHGGV